MNNKSRGKYFESKIAEILRKEFGFKKSDLHRHYESGIATGEYGDIQIPLPIIVECKYYKYVELDALLFSEKKKYLDDWIKQVQKDAKKYLADKEELPFHFVVTSKPNYRFNLAIIPLESNKENVFIPIQEVLKVKHKAFTMLDDEEVLITDLKQLLIQLRR